MKLISFLKRTGGLLMWFGFPMYLLITYEMCKSDVHPLIIALWCTVMSGFIGYSFCDDGIFKKKQPVKKP